MLIMDNPLGFHEPSQQNRQQSSFARSLRNWMFSSEQSVPPRTSSLATKDDDGSVNITFYSFPRIWNFSPYFSPRRFRGFTRGAKTEENSKGARLSKWKLAAWQWELPFPVWILLGGIHGKWFSLGFGEGIAHQVSFSPLLLCLLSIFGEVRCDKR